MIYCPPRSMNPPRHNRRSGPHSTAFSLLAALSLCASQAYAGPSLSVRIAFIGDTTSDAHAGAIQGLREANAQGKFLGLTYKLVDAVDITSASAAQVSAVVVAGEAASLPALAAQATGTPLLNVTADDNSLRSHCSDNLLHTIPSQAMRADAVQQWRKKQPDSQAEAHAWHASAELYAGSQLNKRYADHAGQPMTDQAWAAWAAVKLVSDTVARLRSGEPGELLTALRNDLAFDGQKGVDMSFRDNGQLRQPLLLVEHGKIVGEAPVRGVAATGDLDSLGASACR